MFSVSLVRLSLFSFVLLSSCATQVGTTNRLSPGMSAAQVQDIMGAPSQTQFVENKWIWKYSLHQPWVGFIPYYLAFNKDTGTLEQWAANEAEFANNQQVLFQTWGMINQTFPPTQKRKVDLTIKRR